MNTENSKTNQSNKFSFYFTYKLNFKNPNNYALVNLSICYRWKEIKSAYSSNRFENFAPAWNGELICLVDHILYLIDKIILKILLKYMRL